MLKRLILQSLRHLGYELKKIPLDEDFKKIITHPYEFRLTDVFRSHSYDIDIYQYADRNSDCLYLFKKKIENGTYRLEEFHCPICDSREFTPVAESKEGFKWGICLGCGLLQQYQRLSKKDLNSFYETGEFTAICVANLNDEYRYALEYKIMSILFLEIFTLLNMSPSNTSVIEIGCGSGGILRAIKEWGAKAVKGYDIDEKRVNYGRKSLPELEVADALSLEPVAYRDFNVFLLSNVLEHLSEPKEFIKNMASLISSSDVRVIIDVPFLDFCYKYSTESFLKFLHIGHLWYLNIFAIERLLNHAGLRIEYVFPRGAAITIVATKKTSSGHNHNGSYWNSVSAINYANHCCIPFNINDRCEQKIRQLRKKYLSKT